MASPAPQQDASRLPRRLTALAGLLILAWLVAGVRRIPEEDGHFRIRTWISGAAPTVVSPGWTFSPPFVSRLIPFAEGTLHVPLKLQGRGGSRGGGLWSREGSAVMAAGTLVLQADRGRPADLSVAFPEGLVAATASGTVAASVREPLSEHARQTPFSDLLVGEGSRAPVPPAVGDHLSGAGLLVDPASRVGFYPAASPPPGDPTPGDRPQRRVLLIGLDGADWDIIDPLMAEGRMPNLERLVQAGARARLRTISPVLSPIIWTSIVTGVGPSRHGIVDFMATSATTGRQIPVTSNMRRVSALWNILTQRGLTTGFVGWWATWPAERVNGFIVSDRVAYQLFGFRDAPAGLRHRTYPEALALLLQKHIVAPAEVGDNEVSRLISATETPLEGIEEETRSLQTILASTRTYLGIGMDLLRAYDPDLKAIYFEGTDTIAHRFMRYREPAMAGVSEIEVAAFGDVVDRYYEYQDEVLGRVLELADDGTVVVVCSDHGFRTGANRPATDPRIEMGGAADWHRKFGVLAISGPGVRQGVRLEDASVLDIGPTILAILGLPVAEDMEGRALTQAFDPALSPGTVASYEPESGRPAGEPVESALDGEILAKLTALGYVSQEGMNALNNTGLTLMERGRFGEAVEVFRRVLEKEPGFLHCRINLGRAHMLMGEEDEAVEIFEAVLREDPSRVEVNNLLGNIHMNQGRTDQAESHFKRSLAVQPNDTNTHNSLGILYEKMGKDDLALEEYRKVIAVDRDYAEGYNNIGLIYRKRREPHRAIELFEQAIRADPSFAGSYNNMGLAYQDIGRLDMARSILERGLEVDPDNAVIINNLGTVDLAENDLETARKRFEEAIRADPEYASAYNNLGAILGLLKRPEEAYEQYRLAADLDPRYTDARFNMATHLLATGRAGEAAGLLEKIIEIDPEYGKALLQLAIIELGRGDLESALGHASAASAALGSVSTPHNLMAEIYLRQNRRLEAKRELQSSLAIDAEQSQVRELLKTLEAEES